MGTHRNQQLHTLLPRTLQSRELVLPVATHWLYGSWQRFGTHTLRPGNSFMGFKLLCDTGKVTSPLWATVARLKRYHCGGESENCPPRGMRLHCARSLTSTPVQKGPRVSPLPRGLASSFTVWPMAQNLLIPFPLWAMA